ncbi:hypothetical protein XA3_13800 [Xylocopilactobacillus apicola]|uniref:Uncharacterized protein n=2 Tax=Xylocopilactobacillus apicola TaxID=2932184 RepID=A0AAU9DSD8_9LACO|nr:hypothetical protein XA3_13800 [Xylocopilactobacillus apicola]
MSSKQKKQRRFYQFWEFWFILVLSTCAFISFKPISVILPNVTLPSNSKTIKIAQKVANDGDYKSKNNVYDYLVQKKESTLGLPVALSIK